MGKAMEVITSNIQGATVAGGNTTPASGDSMQIRNANPASKTCMLQMWSWLQGAGFVQVTSSFLHDTTRGMRFSTGADQPDPYFSYGTYQPLKPQDTLTGFISANDAPPNMESLFFLNYYEDLPGIDAHLLKFDEIKDRIVNITTVENTITPVAVLGYSGSQALNAGSDLLHANTDYAVLGCSTNANVGAITLKGPDTGNMRVGVPGNFQDRFITDTWFVDLSRYTGFATIPIINSANKSGTFIEVVSNEAANALEFSLVLAELSKL